MKKLISIFICLVMLATLLSGCTSDNKATTQKNITFMGWGYESEKAVFTKMIENYMKENPGVKVKYIVAPSAEYDVKLNAMIQAGTEPDVFFLKPENLMAWSDAGKLLNLQKYVDSSKNINIKNVWESAINRYRYDGNMIGQGDLWAMPKDIGPWSMVYNKKLFAEKGIKAPTLQNPWTWDQFLENAKKLTYTDAKGKKIYGATYFQLETAVWSNGADFLDKSKKKVTIDTPQFAQAMQFVADLRLKHKVMPSVDEESSVGAYARWLNGQSAMFAMGPWDQSAFWKLNFEWDLMPWPTSPTTGKAIAHLGSAGFAVSAKSKYKEEAFKLAAYFSVDKEGQKTNYEMGQAVPNLIDMAENEYKKLDKAPISKEIFFDIMKNGKGKPEEGTYNGEWLAEFWLNANKVWTGEMTAAQYCKETQPKMQRLLDKAITLQKENK